MARAKKFLRNTKVPKDPAAQKAVTVLLEDVRHDFKAFGEDLVSVRREVHQEIGSVRHEIGSLRQEMRAGFQKIHTRLDRLEKEVRVLREMIGAPGQPNFITKKQYEHLDARLQKVEATLAARRAA